MQIRGRQLIKKLGFYDFTKSKKLLIHQNMGFTNPKCGCYKIKIIDFTKSKMWVLQIKNSRCRFYKIQNMSFTNPKCGYYKIKIIGFTKSKILVLQIKYLKCRFYKIQNVGFTNKKFKM